MGVKDFNISYILKWTPQAVECYERKCRCDGCLIYKMLGGRCKMKQTVLKVFAAIGEPPPPPPNNEPDIEEIYDYIDEGLQLKEIAKIYDIDYQKFLQFTQAHGINGKQLKTGELSLRYRKRRNKNNG